MNYPMKVWHPQLNVAVRAGVGRLPHERKGLCQCVCVGGHLNPGALPSTHDTPLNCVEVRAECALLVAACTSRPTAAQKLLDCCPSCHGRRATTREPLNEFVVRKEHHGKGITWYMREVWDTARPLARFRSRQLGPPLRGREADLNEWHSAPTGPRIHGLGWLETVAQPRILVF